MHFSNKLFVQLKIVKDIKYLRKIILDIKSKNQLIGFVPTMGALHNGHVSLLKESINENQFTICSIYVNPTQFNDPNDFETYPRDDNTDIELLESIDCDLLFLPSDHEMYPQGEPVYKYDYSECMNILEGEKRPGHFSGVITIIHKLFDLIKPDRAYFGEKDYQQLWLIKLFIKTFKLAIEIKTCKTIRDRNGLALSSRNKKLTRNETEQARSLFKALDRFRHGVKEQGELDYKDFCALRDNIMETVLCNPIIKLDYFEVIEDENFRFVNQIKNSKKYRILIAAYIGHTRLIDNMLIE